jgi:glycosyltransferase involved in cell wall biosynthesis
MRAALVALSVRGAMGQYLEALFAELGRHCQLYLFVPRHFAAEPIAAERIFRFATGTNRIRALLQLVNLVVAIRVWKQVQAIRPAVVHVFNGEGYPWTLIWAFLAQKQGLPLLVTVHDPEPHPGNMWEWLNARLRPYVLRRAASVHVHSERFVTAVKAQGARDVKVIPHGSLAPRFLRYRKPGIQREPIALFFGRIEAYKGLETLVEAGIRLNGKVKVVIAGPGRLPQAVVRKIKQHREVFELHNRFLEDWEVAELLQRASVCVLPYRQASQSAIPLIAAAFGVPVIASAVGAFVEDVPAVGGLLVAKDDPEALASGIIQAFSLTPTYPADLEFEHLAKRFAQWYSEHVG